MIEGSLAYVTGRKTVDEQGRFDMDLWFTFAAGILLAIAAVLVAIPAVRQVPSGTRWAVAAIGTIALAAGAGGTGIILRPDPPMEVSFSKPIPGALVSPGKNVDLVGAVRGLPKNHKLWIVSKPFDNASYYYVVTGKQAAEANGPWERTDEQVGDKSDYGKGFYYFAVNADQDCSEALEGLKVPRRLYTTPKNPQPDYDAIAWPSGCKIEGQDTHINFVKKP